MGVGGGVRGVMIAIHCKMLQRSQRLRRVEEDEREIAYGEKKTDRLSNVNSFLR